MSSLIETEGLSDKKVSTIRQLSGISDEDFKNHSFWADSKRNKMQQVRVKIS